jgi:hypothetical protein
LAESTFNLSKKGLTKQFDIIHKYPGNYWIAILVEKPLDSGGYYDSNFKVQISIINGGRVILERTVSDTSFYFYGGKMEHSGFSLFNYKVPSELPIGVPLSIKIKVLEENIGFCNKYGQQNIIISKFSDE